MVTLFKHFRSLLAKLTVSISQTMSESPLQDPTNQPENPGSEAKEPIQDKQNQAGPPSENPVTPTVEATKPVEASPKEAVPPPSSPAQKNFKLQRKLVIGVAIAILVFVLGAFVFAARNLPSLAEIENPKADLSTQVFSADGEVLQNFYSDQDRITVELNEISPNLINALIATEDARFYGHAGVDPVAPFAIMKDVLTSQGVRGGSTITQQLARNLYNKKVGKDRSLTRKLKEMIVSWIIERKFTKQEILAGYLNTVNIYGSSYGIEMACQSLFNKSARKVTIEEAALIVGMLKGQGLFNPYTKPENATNRRNTVINLMVQHEILNPDSIDVDSIKEIPLSDYVVAKQGQSHVRGLAPYFREHVRNYLKGWCKDNGHDLYTDGLRVYTTIDSRMQRHAEKAVEEHLSGLQKDFDKHIKGKEPYKKDPSIITRLQRQSYRYLSAKKAKKTATEIAEEFDTPRKMSIFTWEGEVDTTMTPMDSLKHYSKFLEVGMVSIDPTNGQVKAWVGGINYKHFKYDHVAKGTRQVGSTFKPFFYATLINEKPEYEPCTPVLNQRVQFLLPDGKYWEPKNSDGSQGGKVTLRRGLATSANLVTAQLLQRLMQDGVGVNEVVKLAQKMGIKSFIDPVPSLILGTADLNVMELTSAYTTFANKGTRAEPVFITRIEDRNGNVLAEFSGKTRKVMPENEAYTMVELLKGVVDEPGGTAGRLRFRYKFTNEIGGKTGTTQNQSDGWFMGITPNLVTGVWVGCAERQMRFRSIRLGQGANMALPIWGLYMQDVYADEEIGLPQDRFERPEGFEVDFSCEVAEEGEEVELNPPNVNELEKYD